MKKNDPRPLMSLSEFIDAHGSHQNHAPVSMDWGDKVFKLKCACGLTWSGVKHEIGVVLRETR